MDAVDGRHARKERNRDAVVAATMELLERGCFTPTAQEIADRAGVSLRSVFRYHDNLDALVAAAGMELMAQRADEMVYRLPSPDDRSLGEQRPVATPYDARGKRCCVCSPEIATGASVAALTIPLRRWGAAASAPFIA